MNKLNIRKFLILITIIGINNGAKAIELHDALAFAYKNNSTLQANQNGLRIRMENFQQALAGFMPQVKAALTKSKTHGKNESAFSPAGRSEQQNLVRSINLTQPLFRGGQNMARLAAAQTDFKAARSDYYSQEQAVIYDSINAYLSFYSAQEKYNISEANVETNKQQLESVTEKFNVGESTQTEIAAARSSLATSEANRLTSYANLEGARANFVKTFGIEPEDITLPNAPSDLPKSLEEFTSKAMSVNFDIETGKHSIKTNKANELAAKGVLLPEVNFTIGSTKNYYNPQQRGGNVNNVSTAAAINVNIPILAQGGAEYSKIRQAKLNTRLSAIDTDNRIKQTKANCISTYAASKAAESKIKATAQAIAAAELAYSGTTQEELVGTKTILDVLNTLNQLFESRVAHVDAQKDYILSSYSIKRLINQLTAQSLVLKVKYFDPEREFKFVKMKVIGF